MWYSSNGMVETYVRRELPGRDTIVQALARHINYGKTTHTHTYFTINGLEDFIFSGYMMYSPPQIAIPFNIADRLFFLKYFRDDIEADICNSRIIDPSEILVSLNTTIQIFTNSTVLISISDDSCIRMCLIDEPGVYEAFSNFLPPVP